MHWLYLSIAILAEVFATSALKSSDGFRHLWPSTIVVLGYGTAFYFLSLTLRHIPIGITYAIWSGVGLVLLAMIGWFYYGEKLDLFGVLGISLILIGIIVLFAFSNTTLH